MTFKNLYFFCIYFLLLSMGKSFGQAPQLVLPTANSNQMKGMVISPTEKMYATFDLDDNIKIWEASTGKLLKNIVRKNVTNIAFMPDDKSLIINTYTPTEIYNIESETSLILGKQEYTHGIDVSPDGKFIAIGTEKLITIWNAKTLQLIDSVKSLWNENVKFSNDNRILAIYGSQNIQLWSVEKKIELKTLKGHTHRITDIQFDKTNNLLLSCGWDSTARLWDVRSGELLVTYKGHKNVVWDAKFYPGKNKIITCSSDSTAQIWDQTSGKSLSTLTGHANWIYRVRISPDEKTFALSDRNGECSIWKSDSAKFLFVFRSGFKTLYYLEYLKNSQQILAGNYDPYLTRVNLITQKIDMDYGIHNERFTSISLSNDEKYLLTTSRDGVVRKIDALTGKVVFHYLAFNGQWATSAAFNFNDSLIAVSGGYQKSSLLNAEGNLVRKIDDVSTYYESAIKFSPDGNYMLHNDRSTVQLINTNNNKRLLTIEGINSFTKEHFSADGKYLITHVEKKLKVWSVTTLQLVREIDINTDYPKRIQISNDSKYVLCVSDSMNIWELNSGKLIKQVVSELNDASFSYNNQNVIIIYSNGQVTVSPIIEEKNIGFIQLADSTNTYKNYFARNNEVLISTSGDNILVRDLINGKTLLQGIGNDVAYGKSAKYLYILKNDVIEAYDMQTFKLTYRHFSIGNKDFLVQDDLGRYDGTEAARKLIYFVCGKEVIELDQAKDQLWVPDLAERSMKKDKINAKTLDQLNICGLTPLVENTGDNATMYHYKILPRRGGLGVTVLFVNGIEAKRYKPEQLKKNGNIYELTVKKEDLKNLFIAGKENPVTVKAFTADNNISSRGIVVTEDKTTEIKTPPSLYAVMVGVSDYKGDELDLKYAAKDATDISSAIANAAKKLLNTDGKDHVFMYNLTTAKERYLLPEKISIKKTLEEIGKKATANDILLIFFAGHGVMEGKNKQFYFLTADASKTSATQAIADVGISTTELTEWMKPQNIKAQKRILIFDACNSGQAIKDFVKMGSSDQNYLAARNDDRAQQIKAIDKLNEKSGLFILSASASSQPAYEMGRYSQGLLTYALLKAIKLQPDILEDGKYLNVSRWFNAAEKMVSDLSKESGARQEPQIVSNTNFNIGMVDDEVITKIILPQEKPLFAASNFQNTDEAIADDDLDLSKLVNLQLSDMSVRGNNSEIVYIPITNSPDAYSLSGRYEVKGNIIKASVNVKQSRALKSKFEISGTKDKLNELAAAIVQKAAEVVK